MTLIEVTVALLIAAALIVIAISSLDDWFLNQRGKSVARNVADLIMVARSEAIRSGDQYVLFFGPLGGTDPGGTQLLDAAGDPAMLVALDDGAAAAADCRIGGGESREAVSAEEGVTPGVSLATVRAPNDAGGAFAAPQSSGSTFRDAAGTARTWVLFRSDGMPIVFSAAGGNCGVLGTAGTGGGAIYLTTGQRDYAVVMSPLGSVRVHTFESGAWSS